MRFRHCFACLRTTQLKLMMFYTSTNKMCRFLVANLLAVQNIVSYKNFWRSVSLLKRHMIWIACTHITLELKKTHVTIWQLFTLSVILIGVMVFHATFNNISAISYGGVLGKNHRHAESHWQTLSHNVVSSTLRLSGIRTHVSGDRHWMHK